MKTLLRKQASSKPPLSVDSAIPVSPAAKAQQAIQSRLRYPVAEPADWAGDGGEPSAEHAFRQSAVAADLSRIPVRNYPELPNQAALEMSSPGDRHEQEADRLADLVTSMKEASGDNIGKTGAAENATTAMLRRKESRAFGARNLVNGEMAPSIANALNSEGRPLDDATRGFFEPRFGADFSHVRVHTDASAGRSASSISARAFTFGSHIVFGNGEYRPQTPSGRHLLAHELAHVTQRGGKLYRRIAPEDVSGQMVGRLMSVTEEFNAPGFAVHSGEVVEILAWSNTLDSVSVRLPAGHINGMTPFDIPKRLLRPPPGTSGLHQYHSGIETVVSSIERGEARITAEKTRRGGPRPGEIPRLEALQRNRRRLLNRRLIQETMFNRFDAMIVHWVSFYNRQFAASGFGDLDPNLVKSMLFQESEIGTAGEFMSVAPSNREMGIHNLAQVIDSSAAALLVMMREMEPALIASYHLQDIERDTAARPAGTRAEDFMWSYVAAGQSQGFQDAVNDFYNTASGTMLDTSYEFWIRTAVRWLFEKRRSVRSWAEAIRAYNGSGPGARRYRNAVTRRARRAEAATAAGSDFIPSR